MSNVLFLIVLESLRLQKLEQALPKDLRPLLSVNKPQERYKPPLPFDFDKSLYMSLAKFNDGSSTKDLV